MQNTDEASLSHALALASGKRIHKIIQKTLNESFSLDSLSYIGALGGDDDSRELLEFHSLLLCGHLGYLNEVHQYHQSYPWKVVLSLQVSWLETLMDEMRSLWEFITENIDVCPPKSPLFKACGWTRAQCFREVFIVAELLALKWRKHLYFHEKSLSVRILLVLAKRNSF